MMLPRIRFYTDEHVARAVVRGLMLIHQILEPDDMNGHVEFL